MEKKIEFEVPRFGVPTKLVNEKKKTFVLFKSEKMNVKETEKWFFFWFK